MIDYRKEIEDRLATRFDSVVINNQICFDTNNAIIHVDAIPYDDGVHNIVIEYADTLEDAKNNAFEDGNQYYPYDFSSVDDMYFAILKEITM